MKFTTHPTESATNNSNGIRQLIFFSTYMTDGVNYFG
jgi:hypothetical protein